MSKNTWIVWALFLMLPGAVGLGIHFVLNDSLDNRITQAAETNTQNGAAEEYLQMYEAWSNLTAEEKANNPWGHAEYGGIDIQRRLEEGRTDRLVSDLPMLDKGITHYPDQLADVLYGLGWEQAVEDYRQERSVAEIVLIASTFLLAGGGLILTGGLVKMLVLSILKKKSDDSDEAESEESEDGVAKQDEKTHETDSSTKSPPMLRRSSENLEPSDDGGTEKTSTESAGTDTEKEDRKGYFQGNKTTGAKPAGMDTEKSGQLPMKPTGSISSASNKSQKDSYFGWAVDSEDSTDFESLMTTEPLTKELTELTEEVSAIREYAAQQQDQMRKLQDGYDWMIIRRFCLRIIRCIDNIEDRVGNVQTQGDMVADCLEDIRDELIFALESSGVEQFKPDLNMSFKGLEKYAEAVRERILTEDESLIGCIAEVARPGYQYLVSDDNVKIVRCAQVKLYESNAVIEQ